MVVVKDHGSEAEVVKVRDDGTVDVRLDHDGRVYRRQPRARFSLVQAASINLDEDQERRLDFIISNGIEASTESKLDPDRAASLWLTYLKEKGCHEPGDWALEGYDYDIWLRRLLLFYTWLEQGKEDPHRHHQSLRLWLGRRGRHPRQFDDELVLRFFKGVKKVRGQSQRSRLQGIRRFVNRKLPTPTGFTRTARDLFWSRDAKEKHGQRGVMRAYAYLVASLQYASLRRISNFAHTVSDKARRRRKTVSQDPDDKHAKDVLVAVNPALRRGKHPCDVRQADTKLFDSTTWGGDWDSRDVLGICFLFWSHKGGELYCDPFWLKRGRSRDEDRLIKDLLASRRWGTGLPDSLFFSAKSSQASCPMGARLTGSLVNSVIKATAKSLGLPKASFSTTSLRKSAMTNLSALGASDKGFLRLSRHVSMRTGRRHYIFPLNRIPRSHKVYRPLLEVDSESGFNTDDLMELVGVMALARQLNPEASGKRRA